MFPAWREATRRSGLTIFIIFPLFFLKLVRKPGPDPAANAIEMPLRAGSPARSISYRHTSPDKKGTNDDSMVAILLNPDKACQ